MTVKEKKCAKITETLCLEMCKTDKLGGGQGKEW